MADDGFTEEPSAGESAAPLDPAQVRRIESVHRGFFYQHLYAVGCLLRVQSSGALAVQVELDEDVEVVLPGRCVYVQVKTRKDRLVWSDVAGAVERFTLLREEHGLGKRAGAASFVIAGNVPPGAELVGRMRSSEWPADVDVYYPTAQVEKDGDDELPVEREAAAALPPAWSDVPSALRWCIQHATEKVAFGTLQPTTLVLKLAACVQYAAAGDRAHRFDAVDLPDLLEQLVVQLHDFPSPPPAYRPQDNEPDLATGQRLRLIVGLSGSGKTAWASQAVLHGPPTIAYLDCGDVPGAALAQVLARELTARLLESDGAASAFRALDSSVEMLRFVNARLAGRGDVLVVLDNVHTVDSATLRTVVEAAADLDVVLIGQPWPGQAQLEARFGIRAETLEGWSVDAVVAVFAAAGCRVDAATGAELRRLTAGLPLYVQNAAWVTKDAYGGDARRFCVDVVHQLHLVELGQEAILARTLDRLSRETAVAASLLSIADVPLSRDEVLTLLVPTIGSPPTTAAALRELARHGLTQTTYGGYLKLHDAFRSLAGGRLDALDDRTVALARERLRDLLVESLPLDPGRFRLWLRLLGQTGQTKTLIDLAGEDMFHEIGVPAELHAQLEAAAESVDMPAQERFWALDALVLWDSQVGEWENAAERVSRMAELAGHSDLDRNALISLYMKQMVLAGTVADRDALEDAFVRGMADAGADAMLQRLLRYNRAQALYAAGEFDDVVEAATDLMRDYYAQLALDPVSTLGVSPRDVIELVKDRSGWADDLKRLADVLRLYALGQLRLGRRSGFAGIHALKFYVASSSWRSALQVGQDVADELIEWGDAVGARMLMEQQVLPILREFGFSDLLVPVRSHYAVILAYCGDIAAARAEMNALDPYEVDTQQAAERQAQRALIEEVATGYRPPLRTDGSNEGDQSAM